MTKAAPVTAIQVVRMDGEILTVQNPHGLRADQLAETVYFIEETLIGLEEEKKQEEKKQPKTPNKTAVLEIRRFGDRHDR